MAERLALIQRLVAAASAIWAIVRSSQVRELFSLPDSEWDPVGPLVIFPEPLPAAMVAACVAIVFVCGIALTLGFAKWQRVVVPIWALCLLGSTTWTNSWGTLLHTEQLLALQAIILGIAALIPASDPWLVVKALAMATVMTYFVAGVAKLRGNGVAWLEGDVLRDQVAYDNLRKAVLGGAYSPLGVRLVELPWLWPLFAWIALVIELGAPAALISQRLAIAWVIAAWVFHLGVLAIMAIVFPYPLSLIAFAPLLPLERFGPWWRTRRGRVTRSRLGAT